MTGLQVTGHFHRYGHVGSTEMGGAKHFERPWLSAHAFTRAHRAHCARIEPVHNAHRLRFGAQELVHMRTDSP